jgi:3-dehydroquinate synthase
MKKTVAGTIRVELGERSYDVVVGVGNLSVSAELAQRINLKARVAVVTDEKVAPLYADKVIDALGKKGLKAGLVVTPAGEEAKNVNTLAALWNKFVELGIDRKSLVVALGGGVVGDLAGFAAGTFLRGVDYIQVPTTLLAQVDSSVGGKTGINLPAGKNLAGMFHQPRGVVIDVETLKTLPDREVRAGLAEVIKYGVIWDEEFLGFLESNITGLLSLDPAILVKAVLRSVEIKAAVVASDETENGLRRILNFGHTLGHVLENLAGYGKYLHGEAVAWGMMVAARLAAEMKMLSHSDADRLTALLEKLTKLPQVKGVSAEQVVGGTKRDKKTVAGTVHYILPEKLGRVVVRSDVDEDMVLRVVEGYISRG